jgi:3-hydroxyisobutyrate dehydrogenase-like beta-hydroxyacid dehydrogenase
MKVHFIGVGKMGLPMATHLAAAGHTVTVSDPSAERCQLAQAQGLALADGLELFAPLGDELVFVLGGWGGVVFRHGGGKVGGQQSF